MSNPIKSTLICTNNTELTRSDKSIQVIRGTRNAIFRLFTDLVGPEGQNLTCTFDLENRVKMSRSRVLAIFVTNFGWTPRDPRGGVWGGCTPSPHQPPRP